MESLEKFQKYCKCKYNGYGMDIFQEAITIAIERYGAIENCNLSLLKSLAKESARNLRVYEFRTSRHDGISILTPKLVQTRERLALHYVAATIETKEQEDEKKSKIPNGHKREMWLEKIRKFKSFGYDDKQIINMLKQPKQGVLWE